MAAQDEIKRALDDHSHWKAQLDLELESGKALFSLEEIGKDTCCDFGKWLHGSDLPHQVRGSDHYRIIKELHQELHSVAARVAKLGSENEAEKAKDLLESDFKETSLKFTGEMIKWMAECHQKD